MSDDAYEKYDPPRTPWWIGRPARQMRRLEEHFRRDGDPVFVWAALDLARDREMPLPTWVVSYLFDGAHEMMGILDKAMAGELIDDVAARVGHALGFGNRRGKGGGFARAAMIERDKEMFFDVIDAVRPAELIEEIDGQWRLTRWWKLNFAYDLVAERWSVHRSVVIKACSRVLQRWRATVSKDDIQLREAISSMRSYIGFDFRCVQEAFDAIEARLNGRDDSMLDEDVA